MEKEGFAAYPANALPAQSLLSGNSIAYLNSQAFPGAVGNTALYAAHVSRRTAEGWRTEELTPNVPKAEVLKLYKVGYAFSPDLSRAVLQVPLIPLTPDATPNVSNLFLRDPAGAYSLVNAARPSVTPEEICGLEGLANCWEFADVSTYAGASTDFSRVMFESNAHLTENAPGTFTESLYESSSGHVRLVGILPDGVPAAGSTAGAGSKAFYFTSAQETDRSVERAISSDGSRVLFQAPADGGEPDSAQSGLTEVYERIDGTETVEVSAPALGAAPAVQTSEPATFWTASIDGSHVFFTSAAELTTESNTGAANNSEDLYEFNLDTLQLRDLTVDTSPADTATGAMMQGVVDSSSDGAYVYFVADGQLVEGKGVDGQPNLYMVHEGGRPVFIATLDGASSCHFTTSVSGDACVWTPYPVVREAYVARDGKHMAFMSTKSIPTVNFPGGYGNTDQETGLADSEVYEYTAPTRPEGTGQLICASCDPSGAQPIGNALLGGISATGSLQEGRPTYNGISSPFYRVQSLSDNGQRLFYGAPASLEATGDSIYEYEQNGEGSCEAVGGCQLLISSPTRTEPDFFLGASDDGNDVFFATSNRLAPTDLDNLRDVYDARVDGGIATPPEESRCVANCQPSISAPGTQAPVSGVVGVPENISPPPPPHSKKCKAKYKLSHGRCVKVKSKHKKRAKGKAKKSRHSRRAR